jgi:hypothetical protein
MSVTIHRIEGTMFCPKCKATAPAGRFCASCGTPIAGQNETCSLAQFDGVWLKDILAAVEYVIENYKEGPEGATFVARHSDNPNWLVDFRRNLRLFTLTSEWRIRPPGMLERKELFAALNKICLGTIAIQCSVDEPKLNCLNLQCSFFITESVSRFDILAFNDAAVALVRHALQIEEIRKFLS